ncbi:hypothetical protein F3Y22_tig00112044pilonHSYRG00120 [Hibiscus syriacus]|uniref:CCHC-type domain-containing protein n=1 Tax=Hibiscus syriacus TaxID=106335 RepID=A0A6A2Y9V1_HIBSY|nr:hypothetical protein F3Y22_tig00112044pilonHSYRG00120 [Hibiscus syriacus]
MSFRFDIEKFDGRINFGLWQVQVKDILIQSGLYKALKGKPTSLSEGKEPDKPSDSSGDKGKSKMSEEEWEELDMRAASQIRLCLAKNVLANVARWSSTNELWEKLEEMYQAKSLSNRLYLKEKFHKLQMEEEVTSKLISEERRLKNGENKSSESGALSVCGNRKKYKGSKKKIICWGCGQPGHLKKDCKNGGANSANGSKKSTKGEVEAFQKAEEELNEIEKERNNAEANRVHYENVMKEKVLPQIKEAETEYMELEKNRKESYRKASVICPESEIEALEDLDGCSTEQLDAKLKRLSQRLMHESNRYSESIDDLRMLYLEKERGERSFSTLCFALALHDMTEAPFRGMDEFDVFMLAEKSAWTPELTLHWLKDPNGYLSHRMISAWREDKETADGSSPLLIVAVRQQLMAAS